LTDQEIVQWLHDEKHIDVDRSTISKMRNQVEHKAEKWYLELRNSTYKFIAMYKKRIDSLFSYQRKLPEIIANTEKDEVKIRAISELHSIEMSIFSLWKQLPNLDIVDRIKDAEQSEELSQEEKDRLLPISSIEDVNGIEQIPDEDKKYWHNWLQCDGCKRCWRDEKLLVYHKRSTNTNCSVPNIE
jgi:hypothetical protein